MWLSAYNIVCTAAAIRIDVDSGEGRQREREEGGEGKSSLYSDENHEAITPNEQFLLHKDSFLHAALDIVIEL